MAIAEEEDLLGEALVANKRAKDDAREYHKLEVNIPKVFLFIIDNKEEDIKVERLVDKEGKPYSQTSFMKVVDLESEVQEPKPLRTSSNRFLNALNPLLSAGERTLKVVKTGSNFDTEYKVTVVKTE